jgi:hypothetical protein
MRILAIDPGLHATAVMFCPGFSPDSGMRWNLLDVPALGDAAAKRPDVKVLRDFIRKFDPTHAFVELVNARPMQGIASTAHFMRSAGYLEATCVVCDVPLFKITPQRWKKFSRIPEGSAKEISRLRALRSLPEISNWFRLKKHHGRAEACLLALYGEHCLASY